MTAAAAFRQQVAQRFGQRAADYRHHARLQRALAWRLARCCAAAGRDRPLPAGVSADLGSGGGAVGQALARLAPELLGPRPLLQVDLSTAWLEHNPLAGRHGRQWDLAQGLPGELRNAALLTSNFALQWLPDPARQLGHWCEQLGPDGLLAMAVPTSGSFQNWRRAAARAGVVCTALPLPAAAELLAAARPWLELEQGRRLRFSGQHLGMAGGLALLRQMRAIGADASPTGGLAPAELRRLLRHWPAEPAVDWEVLLLVGRRRPDACSLSPPSGSQP